MKIQAERMTAAVERYRKKEMIQMVNTLLQANDAVSKTAVSNPQGASDALAQCQESAIALGNAIEALGESYASLVQILEDYCENIYQMNESLSDEKTCRKVAKKIQKQLTGLQNSIRYELPKDKKEVVFLPYKASMWDSLESVWKAADADPDCDAYVMPIPYFDKNPDGSFKEEHYEGDLYPKDVPVIRYDEYDLETRHPDVIYIHNPYDECNHVTSVHPYFYAKNLRNYTDKLVYIPYFILGEIEPDDQAAIDGMKHFCFTPGTIYADQVIVQSENMRQIYINEYMKAAKEMGLDGEHVDRRFLEKKFLGTGSPKLDKVQNTKKEDLEILAEWLKIIEKPDGSWKKIIFYNTSVSALLHYDEKMLRKMESVFETFKENRDEVALLWRPHPLIQATIESMRPQLWEEYRRIRDKYIEEGWGIYDDSADLDRAVVISDVYYGDQSSVVSLCRCLNKNVIIQSVITAPNNIQNMMEWAIAYDDRIYFSAIEINGIYSVDLKKGSIEIETHIQEDERCIYRAYGIGKQKNNKIYLSPLLSNQIIIYDLQNKHYEAIELPNIEGEALKHQRSKEIIIHEKNIYFLPMTGYYPYIVKLDENTKCVETYDVKRYCESLEDSFCNASTVLNDQKFLLCLNGNLYEFLYETNEIKRSTYRYNEKIRDICIDKENIILLLKEKIIVCDYEGNVVDAIELDGFTIPKDERISRIYKKNDKIFLYSDHSTQAKQVYCINSRTRNCIYTEIEEKESYFLSLVEDENEILFIYFINSYICLIRDDLSIEKHPVNVRPDINAYVLGEKNWWQKLQSTYNCLNELELLMKDLSGS